MQRTFTPRVACRLNQIRCVAQAGCAVRFERADTGSRQNHMRAPGLLVLGPVGELIQADESNDRPLWTLQRGDQRAQAVAREVPGVGLELRITIDGEMRLTQVYGGGVRLGIAAAEKRQALRDTGWHEAPTS